MMLMMTSRCSLRENWRTMLRKNEETLDTFFLSANIYVLFALFDLQDGFIAFYISNGVINIHLRSAY